MNDLPNDSIATGWKTLQEREVYSSPGFTLFENLVLDPNGNERLRSLIKVKSGSVVIVPKYEDKFYLVGQHRYGSDSYSLEFPNGGVEKGEPVIDAAKRELEEETGLVSESWTDLGEFDPLNGMMRRKCYILLADQVKFSENRKRFPDKYERLDLKSINKDELEMMMQRSEIGDSFTLVAYLKLKLNSLI